MIQYNDIRGFPENYNNIQMKVGTKANNNALKVVIYCKKKCNFYGNAVEQVQLLD